MDTPLDPAAPAPDELTLDLSRYPGIRRIPWIAVSLAVNFAFVTGFWFVTADSQPAEAPREYTSAIASDWEPLEEEFEDELEVDIRSDEAPIEDPVITDAEREEAIDDPSMLDAQEDGRSETLELGVRSGPRPSNKTLAGVEIGGGNTGAFSHRVAG